MTHLEECQFYITDLCGLQCQGCITYNNWHWGQHLELSPQVLRDLQQWSQQVDFDMISVLGGEPLLHPSITLWLAEIADLWPRSSRWITTNGERLRDLHSEVMAWAAQGWRLEISAHRPELVEELELLLPSWFGGSWSASQPGDPWSSRRLIVEGQVWAELSRATEFYQQPWRLDQGRVTWDRVRPAVEQWKACPARACHYMIDARLYACPQQALLPRISQRLCIDPVYQGLAQRDWGVSPEEFSAGADLEQPRDQCGLCQWAEPQRTDLARVRGTKIIPLTAV